MTSQTRNDATPSAPDALAQVATCIEAARTHRFGDLTLAREDARRGLDLLRVLKFSESRYEEEEAELQVILANADRVEGRIDSAVIQCHAALKLLHGRPASRVACEAWNSLGWAYAQSGEFASALRYTMRGLKLARELGTRTWEAHALDVLGTVYAIFGDTVEALRHLEEAGRIAKAQRDPKRLASVMNNVAMTQLMREEYEPALASALESLRIAREEGLKVSEPNIVDTVASVLTAMGRFAEAEGYLVPTIEEARKRPPNKALANLLNNYGMVRAAAQDPLQAEALHREALEIAARIGDPVLEMQCHKRLADLYSGASRWREAYTAFRQYHDLNQSVAGAKAAKRITVTRIAGEIDALQDAAEPSDSADEGAKAFGAMEALTARLRARNQELAEAKLAAEAASEAKTRFLANMSHELRTPLNGVLGMAHLLSGTTLNDAQARYCRAIVTSGRALNDIVTDLLDFSQLEAGRLALESVEIDPARIVDEVVQSVQPSASARGLRMTFAPDERLPRPLRGDPKRLRQVLQHVVGNAIKFTKEGSVEIRAAVLDSREGDPRAWIRFTVRDTGIGIGPEAAVNLFKPFVQADSSSTRPYGGSGLGLATSRRLVELMGGTLDFRSEAGVGSEFRFELPFRSGPGDPRGHE